MRDIYSICTNYPIATRKTTIMCNNKQVLDEVFVMCGIIMV